MSQDRNPAGPVTRGVEQQLAPAVTSGEHVQGVYRAAPAALTDGKSAPLKLDSAGALVTSTGGTPSAANPTGVSPTAALAATGQLAVAGAGLRITAFTWRETAGATGRFTLYHGTANTDPVIANVAVTADQGAGGDWGGQEILVPNGVYLEINSGAVSVVGFTKTVS